MRVRHNHRAEPTQKTQLSGKDWVGYGVVGTSATDTQPSPLTKIGFSDLSFFWIKGLEQNTRKLFPIFFLCETVYFRCHHAVNYE